MTSSPALTQPDQPVRPARPDVLPELLRRTMRQHGAGVAVITTRGPDGPVGFCATSLTSVSLQPPTVSFAVALGSTSGQAWERSGQGLVHLLRSDQGALAANFARSSPDKFDPIGWRWGPGAQPLLDDVHSWMLISTRLRLVVGDHLLIVADVRDVAVPATAGPGSGPGPGPRPARPPGPGPLIHHNGGFHMVTALPD